LGVANNSNFSPSVLTELGDPRRHASFLGFHQEPGHSRTVLNDGIAPFERITQPVAARIGFAPAGNNGMTDHGGTSYARVYMNVEAVSALTNEKAEFPVGSMIVREKLASETQASPELLTVMIKRWRGFSPKTNDWEFLVVGAELNKIKVRQKTGNCADCHRSVIQTDFVNKNNYGPRSAVTSN